MRRRRRRGMERETETENRVEIEEGDKWKMRCQRGMWELFFSWVVTHLH